ncbi:MAG: transposase [Clostridia bacterium]|nr:transposase [Clostridia bacterium]
MDKIPKRKPTRMYGADYDTVGAYFITICTQDRRCILSRIVGDDVLGVPSYRTDLSPLGKIAEKYINQLNIFYDHLSVEEYVIMPNHIHIMLIVSENGTPRTSSPTKQTKFVPHFVSTFKRFCNKEIGENIWQRGYQDHIIRNRQDYEEHVKYILENPLRWHYDKLYSK